MPGEDRQVTAETNRQHAQVEASAGGDRGDVGSVDRDAVEHFGVAAHRNRGSGISRRRGGMRSGPPGRSRAPATRNMTEPQKQSGPVPTRSAVAVTIILRPRP
jgi:hypothetical protein